MAECNKGTRVSSHIPRATHSCDARLSSGEDGRHRSPVEVSSGYSRAEHEKVGRSPGAGLFSTQPESAQSPPASFYEAVAFVSMTLSLVTCSLPPAISHVVSAFSCITLDASSHPSSSKPVAASAALPRTMSVPSLLMAVMESLSSSRESLVRYQLQNRSIHIRVDKTGMGLGLLSPAVCQKKRGRRSLLSLAKDCARLDVAAGRHSSIFRALRANEARGGLCP